MTATRNADFMDVGMFNAARHALAMLLDPMRRGEEGDLVPEHSAGVRPDDRSPHARLRTNVVRL